MSVEKQVEIMEQNTKLDLSNVDVNGERIKAIVTIVLTAGFNIANLYGYSVDAEPVINGVLTIVSFVLIVYSWWKNQNVTPEAATAQVFLRFLKGKDKVEKEPEPEAEKQESMAEPQPEEE